MPWRAPIVAVAVLGAFITLPLVALIFRAVGADQFGAFTRADGVASAVTLSFATAGATLAIALVIGTPAAFALARVTFPGRGLANALVEVPVVLPPAVAGLALLLAFGRQGLVGAWLVDAGLSLAFSTTGVVVAQCFVSLPFYVRTARAAFERVERDLESAALVDGANGWQVLRHVTLPLATPSLIAGSVLCWSRALGEFGATLMFAGSLRGRTQTMPLAIYALLETDVTGAVMLGGAFVGIAIMTLAIATAATRRIVSLEG